MAGAAVCVFAFLLAFGAAVAGTAGAEAPAVPAAAFYAEDEAVENIPESLQFIVREYDGNVCVFHRGYSGVPAIVTDISVDGLPGADRELLARGIEIDGREALLRLLEDLGS